jgi:hypothetical protein
MTRGELFSGALFVALAVAGCQSSTPGTRGNDRVQPKYDETGRLTQLTFDRDGDGRIDTWGFMDGARVVRVEVDENGDGKVDRWEYHTGSKGSTDSKGSTGSQAGSAGSGAAGTKSAEPGVDQTVERIERATRHDGIVSRREYFDSGQLTRVEEDTDGNGKIDKWETYTEGALAVTALDTKGRGTPDRRLIYQLDGTLNRIEVDPSGSGTFQPLSR